MALFNIKAFKGKRIINMTYYKANYWAFNYWTGAITALVPPQRKNKLNVITFFYPQSKEGKEDEIVLWLKTSEADGALISFHVRESGAHKSE